MTTTSQLTATGAEKPAGILQGLLLGVALTFALYAGLVTWQRLTTLKVGTRSDFVEEWTSARSYWEGREVYAPMTESLPRYFGPEATSTLPINGHPPTAVALALPLAWLAYDRAWLVWNLISLGLAGAGLWWLARSGAVRLPAWSWLLAAGLFALSHPLRQQVFDGQLNLIILFLLAGALALDRSGRSAAAGAMVAGAAAVKLFPAFLLIYFVGRRDWRAVAGAAAGGVALFLLTTLVLGPNVWLTYLRDVLPILGEYRANIGNHSLAGLASKLFASESRAHSLVNAPGLAPYFFLASAGAVAITCGMLAWRARSRDECDRAFGLTVVGMLLCSPLTWNHGLTLVLLPGLCLLGSGPEFAAWPRRLAGVAVLLTLGFLRHAAVWQWVQTRALAEGSEVVPATYGVTLVAFVTFFLFALLVLLAAGRIRRLPDPAGSG